MHANFQRSSYAAMLVLLWMLVMLRVLVLTAVPMLLLLLLDVMMIR